MTAASPAASTPADPWRSHPARIVGVAAELPGVRTYELELVEPAARESYRFTAGQFNMLYLPGIGEAAISISSDAADTATLAHTVRAVGNVTDALARLEVGDQVLIRGPFGTPWPLDVAVGRDLVLIGGGLGLASQRAAIHAVARRRGSFRRCSLLHGAKRPDGIFYAREHAAWQAAGIDVRVVVDEAAPGWDGRVGLVTDLLDDLPLDPAATTILCCGPDAMMAAVARAAIGRGVASESIFLSLERNMACAVRHCGLCQFGPLFVCRDGPVLRYDRVAAHLAVSGL